MKRVVPFIYDVEEGERIALNVTAYNFMEPLLVVAVLDGQVLPVQAQGFSFEITKPEGSAHVLGLSWEFADDSPSGASYKVEVTGSSGTEGDTFFVERSTSERNRVLVFRVKGDTGPK